MGLHCCTISLHFCDEAILYIDSLNSTLLPTSSSISCYFYVLPGMQIFSRDRNQTYGECGTSKAKTFPAKTNLYSNHKV